MGAVKWRVTTSAHSFDLERFVRADKDGNEVWAKEAYYRRRADLLAGIKRRGLSSAIAADVPSHHPDAARLLCAVAESPTGLSDAQRAALEKARAGAKRAREKRR